MIEKFINVILLKFAKKNCNTPDSILFYKLQSSAAGYFAFFFKAQVQYRCPA
jgi:hypothetical protein